MRPQQQNRRMRGRNNNGGGGNNNNRKGPNPLTRTYESNGPDVKIRGSAQQIAEKYATLARDAQSSGDRVMAENYLQHAEHYNRIIAAAQAQMPIQNVQQNRDDFDDDLDEDRDEFDNIGNSGGADTPAAANGSGPQPVIEGTPAELAFNQENGRENNNRRENGQREGGQRDNNGRDRHRDRRNGGYGQYGQNGPRGDNGQRGEGQRGGEPGGQQFDQNRREDAQAQPEGVAGADTPAGSVEAAPFDSFSPAALAAQAERNAAAMDNGGRRPRRARRPRGSSEQSNAGEQGDAEQAGSPDEERNMADNGQGMTDSGHAAAEEAQAAPVENTTGETAGAGESAGASEPANADASG